MIIREKAKEIGSTEVAEEKLAVINLALGVVLRRYHSLAQAAAQHGWLARKCRLTTITMVIDPSAGEEIPRLFSHRAHRVAQ